MAPPALPQPPDRQPDEHPHNRRAAALRPTLVPAPEPAHSTRPPGGERPGRLPGPEGPDRLASGAVVSTAPFAPLLPLPTLRSHTVELPAVPASVRAARGAAGEALTSWGVAEALHDSVVLVVSELMTNAVTHSGSERIVCRVHGTAGLIRVEIEDQDRGRRRPEPRQPGPEEPSGRGLLLVGTVSRDWGVTPAPHGGPGRVVWAELTAETDTGTADDETGASHESGGEESGAVRLADPSWTAGRPRPGTGHPHARTPRPHGPRCPNTMP